MASLFLVTMEHVGKVGEVSPIPRRVLVSQEEFW